MVNDQAPVTCDRRMGARNRKLAADNRVNHVQEAHQHKHAPQSGKTQNQLQPTLGQQRPQSRPLQQQSQQHQPQQQQPQQVPLTARQRRRAKERQARERKKQASLSQSQQQQQQPQPQQQQHNKPADTVGQYQANVTWTQDKGVSENLANKLHQQPTTGRNIIYLTNRANLAAQAELLADVEPFRLPFS